MGSQGIYKLIEPLEEHGDEPEPEFEENTEEDEPEVESDEELHDELENGLAQLDLIGDHDEQQELVDEPIVESHTIENELAGLDDDPLVADSSDSDGDDDSAEHYVPPMTEEEHTVNMQIDQDLMALAIETTMASYRRSSFLRNSPGKKRTKKKMT